MIGILQDRGGTGQLKRSELLSLSVLQLLLLLSVAVFSQAYCQRQDVAAYLLRRNAEIAKLPGENCKMERGS